MSVGYDSSKVPDVKTLDDLMGKEFKGKVALNGDPTQAGAAFSGVMMASVLNGGSADDLQPGVDYFSKLKKVGNYIPVDPDPSTIETGQTPVVFDWDYLNAAETAKLPSWKVVIPSGGPAVAGYYYQAINKDAPHPAAARLWQEFLYSDEGQNLWLAGGARPVRADAMVKAGTIDKAKYDALPPAPSDIVLPTNEQNTKGAEYLSENWAKAVG
jgi:putative spermidine/putrescine transport system substrate-binding protein